MLKDLFNSTYLKKDFLYFLPFSRFGDPSVVPEESYGQKTYQATNQNNLKLVIPLAQ
jgi:hypothetical protein